MKTIASFAGGAIVLTEDAGVFALSVDESVSVGGGEVAGIVKVQGKGSVVLDAALGLKLGEALLNAHLPPALVPLAQVVEGVANQALLSLG
jgi:hypothetical protein